MKTQDTIHHPLPRSPSLWYDGVFECSFCYLCVPYVYMYCTCTIYCYPASPTVHTVSKNSSGHLRRLNNIRVEENRNITWLVRWRKGPFLLVLGWQRRRRKKAYLLQPQLGNRKVLPEKKEGVKKNPAIDSINILSLLIWGLMGFFGYENPHLKKSFTYMGSKGSVWSGQIFKKAYHINLGFKICHRNP